jgi:hypothetical protein
MNVHSTLTREQVAALGDILDRLAGTPLERTGDIAITFDDVRYVVSSQTGAYAAAVVVRDGAQEIIGEIAPYRREHVRHMADNALALAHNVAAMTVFTVHELLVRDWDELSAVEQRNVGRRFRRLLDAKPLGEIDAWKTSDNEWHYRRR